MLTKDDLTKIKLVVEDTVEVKLEQKLEQKLKPIHQKIDKMNRKLDLSIKYFDTITSDHGKRIKRVEKHLNLPPFDGYA